MAYIHLNSLWFLLLIVMNIIRAAAAHASTLPLFFFFLSFTHILPYIFCHIVDYAHPSFLLQIAMSVQFLLKKATLLIISSLCPSVPPFLFPLLAGLSTSLFSYAYMPRFADLAVLPSPSLPPSFFLSFLFACLPYFSLKRDYNYLGRTKSSHFSISISPAVCIIMSSLPKTKSHLTVHQLISRKFKQYSQQGNEQRSETLQCPPIHIQTYATKRVHTQTSVYISQRQTRL